MIQTAAFGDAIRQFLMPLVGTLVGALVGYRLAISAHIREKRHDFIVEQLRDFYAPLLALRDEIASKTDQCWNPLQNYFNADHFHKAVWPLYRQIATLFSSKLWLASPSTRAFHANVIKVIEGFQFGMDNNLIDDRDLDSRISKALQPFYDHLSMMLDSLQRKLLPGEV